MAKTVRRRQSAKQSAATVFGAVVLVLVLVVAVGAMIQGSRRTTSDSPMQRVLSANLSAHHFIADQARMGADGTVYVAGRFSGIELLQPTNAEGWNELAQGVADTLAKELRGVASAVEVEYFLVNESKARARATVR